MIVGGVRTPFSRAFPPGGAPAAFRDVGADELARIAIVELLARTGCAPADVDEVLLGCAAMPADAPNVARVAALRAGIPATVPAVTIQRNCGSALDAITTAADRIRAGRASCLIAGGTESMSRVPFFFPEATQRLFLAAQRAKGALGRLRPMLRLRPRHFRPVVALEVGLTDPVSTLNMGQTAEKLAREWGCTREQQDAYAAQSHRRALAAAKEGRLGAEIVPVYVPPAFGKVVTADDGPRDDSTPERLGRLRPIFDKDFGSVTAGNSSQITDGAAVVLVASAERAKAEGWKPLARLRGHAWAGIEPERMGLGPALALPRALDEAGVTLADLDLVELNEAFAAVVLANQRALASAEFAKARLGRDAAVGEISDDRLNVDGGAIALGHPVGATGARLVLTLAREMARRDVTLGAATLCVGGGQGGAVILERI